MKVFTTGIFPLVVYALLLCLPLPASGQSVPTATSDFYVSTSGNDTNPGSFDSPWASFSKAVSEVIPGETVYIREGSYSERLVISASGTEGNPIVFTAYPDEEVIIDGSGLNYPNTWCGTIHIHGEHDVTVEGFTVRNSPVMAIFANDSQRITIRNNKTVNSGNSGIMAWGDNGLTIHGNDIDRACNSDKNPQECISVSHSEDFVISENIVHDGFMEGIDVKNGAHTGLIFGNNIYNMTRLGIYVDAWETHTYSIVVSKNTVYNCSEGIRVNSENGGLTENIVVRSNLLYENAGCGIWVNAGGINTANHLVNEVLIDGNIIRNNSEDGIRISTPTNGTTTNITLQNNVITGSGRTGILVSDFTDGAATMGGLSIINNTLYNNGIEEAWACGGIYMNAGIATEVLIRNNIVSRNHMFSIGVTNDSATGEIIVDHNLIDGFMASNTYNETKGDLFIEGSPLFVDAAGDDFRLKAGSPAIDAGSAAEAPYLDFSRVKRPRGNSVDVGSFEFPD